MANERGIEDKLIDRLAQSGYSVVTLNKQSDMVENIREQLSKLNGVELTSDDVDDIRTKLFNKAENYYFSFAINDAFQSGVTLTRKVDGRPVFIKLISRDIANNSFQVARQTIDGDSRYDVLLLINGIPVVVIELKDASVELEAAINQLGRYSRTAFTGWCKFIQLFVVSNETDTRYGANSGNITKERMFKWSDADNNIISNLYKFESTFLDRFILFDTLTNYMIRLNSNGEKSLVVLRPYQIFAIKAVINRITKPYNKLNPIENNGYIFHTTGSGKTLTSFKCMSNIANMPNVAKVIFLVDRKDLDDQTKQVFKSVDSRIDIDDTDNTKELIRAIGSGSKTVITTIQKLSRAVKNAESDESSPLRPLADQQVVFIIDECHRTQFGSMHLSIKRYFKYGRYIGFTGTPIYSGINATSDSQTTKSLFGAELHRYRIGDAIRDNNVLGFSIDYHNTVKENLKYHTMSEHERTLDSGVDSSEILLNPSRITNIVNRIFTIHGIKTMNKRYTALFAVQSIEALVLYYNEFKKQNEQRPESERLLVSAIYTPSDQTIENETSKSSDLSITNREKLDEIRSDFNREFSLNCTDDTSFRSEVAKSLKCYREKHLDILIVVNMFLTGFDSKMTNTMYVDKNMVYHGLLQAFSRTNRVEGPRKSFGNIVCFRNIKQDVDNAISAFSAGSDSCVAITKTYDECLKALIKSIDSIIECIGTNYSEFVAANKTESEKEKFVASMRTLNRALHETKQFEQFNWDAIADKLSEDDYNRLIGQFKEINSDAQRQYGTDKLSMLSYIDFCMELVETDKIDLDYITQLISKIDLTTVESATVCADRIKSLVEKSSNDTLMYKKELIKLFLEKLIAKRTAGDINETCSVLMEFNKFLEAEKQQEIKKIQVDSGLERDFIESLVIKQQVIGKVKDSDISDAVKERNPNLGFMRCRSIKSAVKEWLSNFSKKFFT